MAAKRNVRAQEEAKEAKANEALKRKQGKVKLLAVAAVSALTVCLLLRISTSLKKSSETKR